MLLNLDIIYKILISLVLASIIGLERERSKKPFGLRDSILVSTASTLFTIIAIIDKSPYILSGIIIGVGFIGSGVISKEKKEIIGITTASVIWMVTAISMAVAFGYYGTALLITLITFLVLRLKKIKKRLSS